MVKGRSSKTYRRKVDETKKWYALREKCRAEKLDHAKKEGKELKLKPLKPLQEYIAAIREANKT